MVTCVPGRAAREEMAWGECRLLDGEPMGIRTGQRGEYARAPAREREREIGEQHVMMLQPGNWHRKTAFYIQAGTSSPVLTILRVNSL